jgi:hypothetical protein
VSGALLFSRSAIKTPPKGGEKCSRCGRLSGGGGVDGGGEVGAEFGDGVEDEIDVGSSDVGAGLVLLLKFGLEIGLVMEFVQVGAVFK